MNLGSFLKQHADLSPDKKAIIFPEGKNKTGQVQYSHLTFKQLNRLASRYAYLLKMQGIQKGTRTLVFIRPCLQFSAITFALFKIGAVPVFIDPGMGKKNLLNAIKQCSPEALIAVPVVHLFKFLYRKFFKSIKISIVAGNSGIFSSPSLFILEKKLAKEVKFHDENLNPEDEAAILFTSGGTGIPKGVVYTQKIFQQQIKSLQEMFKLTTQDTDLPGFPLFSLFTLTMGMTSCIPDMNPSKPAKADPAKLVANIIDQGATFVAGSPAIWKNVANYCINHKIKLPSVKYLVMFGAPVSVKMHEQFAKILPYGTTYTPYGATESLPVSNYSGQEILKETAELTQQGRGTCIGYPAPGISIKIIRTTDDIIEQWHDDLELHDGEVGEIVVQGDVATREYLFMPEQTRLSKINQADGNFWHRMGDVGYKDEKGRLWFCGRKGHRIDWQKKTYYSIPCEAVFNNHPAVERTALIRTAKGPAIAVEKNLLLNNLSDEMINQLKTYAKKHDHTKEIENFYLVDQFPVDVRHNIKIDRKRLGEIIETRR